MTTQRTALAVVVFFAALLLGVVIGARWFSPNLGGGIAAPQAEQSVADPVKAVEGTIRTFSDDRPSRWTLDPQTYPASSVVFDVTEETELRTNGVPLTVGLWARVELVSRPAGLWARTIELQPAPAPVSVEGPLTLVSAEQPGLWVIRSYPFVVDSATQLVTHGLTPAPDVWARAELVKMPADAGGLARRRASVVELLSPASQPGPADEMVDRVHQMDTTTGRWQVGDTEVVVGANVPITGSVALGDVVWVRGQRTATGLQATSVARLPDGPEVYFSGRLEEVRNDQWRVRADQGQQVTVYVSSAHIEGEPVLGGVVRVYGLEAQPGRVHALRIWAEQGGAASQWVGWLQSMEAVGAVGLWRIGRAVDTTLQPVFLVVDGNTALDTSQAPLALGAWLRVTALQESETLYRGQQVSVLARPPKQTVQGVVNAMPESGIGEWQVDRYRVVVTDETAVVGNPQVGSFVFVSGQPDYTAALVAQVVETMAR